MKLKDFVNRASLIIGDELGNETIIFYNEFVNYLILNKPQYATKQKETTFLCENTDNDKYVIPKDTLFICGIYKDDKNAKYLNVNNIIAFFEKGKYKIKYTEEPEVVNNIDDVVTHNPDFDDSLVYYICYKKAVINQYPQTLCNIYYQSFNDLFNSACKNFSKTKSNYIPKKSFL